MKKTTRLAAMVIAIIMAFTLQLNVFARDESQLVSVSVDQPSAWAMEGVRWSEIYGLTHQDTFTKYTSNIKREELYAVCVNLFEKISGEAITPVEKSPFADIESPEILKACAIKILTGTGNFEPEKEVTRLEMVIAVCNTIKAAESGLDFRTNIQLAFKDVDEIPSESIDIVEYAVSKEILKGKNGNVLDLLTPSTRQELMAFVTRVYEFVIYETGRDSKGLIWKVSDEDSTVYLLGSVHMADSSMYPLSKAMLGAFEKSDVLVVEANIADIEEEIQYIQQKMVYADDNTLENNVPKEVYDRFVEFIKPTGIPKDFYNKLKPWYAAMLVQSLQLSQNTYDANLGIDLFFTVKAMGTKEIIEIEGLKFQIDMFDSFSKELQVQYLASTLAENNEKQEEQIEIIALLMKAWKSGDSAELEKLIALEADNSEEGKEFNEKMWLTRNNNMSQKVKVYLADPAKKTYFVVVGAGHMVGESGIVTQLMDEYKIEQIK